VSRIIFPFKLLAILALLLTGCKDESRMGYLTLTGHVLVMNVRLAAANFVVTTKVNRAFPEGATLVASFENPAGGPLLQVPANARTALAPATFESPDLTCIKKDRRYNFTITLADAAGKTIEVHEGKITAELDQSALPSAPLVAGPGYDKNPDKGADTTGKDWSRAKTCPP
jgi:hypothetical protein